MTGYEFRAPASAEEENAYHDIRRTELFEARGRGAYYLRDHPHESVPANHQRLLFRNGVPVAAIRIDLGGPFTYFRMVAVRHDVQRGGIGRELIDQAESFVRSQGGSADIRLHAHPDSVGFYERCGFAFADDVEPFNGSVPMAKRLPVG